MWKATMKALSARRSFVMQQSYRQNLRYLRIHFYYVKRSNKALMALNCFNSKKNLRGRGLVRNTCIVTGRARGLTSLNVNRMQLRHLTEIGAIKGLKKYSW